MPVWCCRQSCDRVDGRRHTRRRRQLRSPYRITTAALRVARTSSLFSQYRLRSPSLHFVAVSLSTDVLLFPVCDQRQRTAAPLSLWNRATSCARVCWQVLHTICAKWPSNVWTVEEDWNRGTEAKNNYLRISTAKDCIEMDSVMWCLGLYKELNAGYQYRR